MLIKEEKLKNSKKYLSKHINNLDDTFIILDDKTQIIDEKLKQIFLEIEKFNYKVNVCDSKKILFNLYDKFKDEIEDFDTVVASGTGGKIVYNILKDKEKFKDKEEYLIKWNRKWINDICYFETNINEFKIQNKKILILEDVIASGNTLYNLINELNKNNNVVAVISVLIQEASPLITKSFIPIYSGTMIKGDKNLDPYWYPPIYSIRHLIHGDDEVKNFYNTFNEKYFNNKKEVENKIKKYRS